MGCTAGADGEVGLGSVHPKEGHGPVQGKGTREAWGQPYKGSHRRSGLKFPRDPTLQGAWVRPQSLRVREVSKTEVTVPLPKAASQPGWESLTKTDRGPPRQTVWF